MRPDTDHAQLTPDDQFRELARVLATGLLRLLRPPSADAPALAAPPPGPEKPPEFLPESP